MDKNIHIIAGSRSDFWDDEGNDKELLEKIREAERKYEGVKIEVTACSGEKLPQMVAPVMNSNKSHGFIALGAYSLPLAGRMREALGFLVENGEIEETRINLEGFFDDGPLKLSPPTGADLVTKSNYCGNHSFIPIIAVPMKDSKTGGLSSYLSVVEQPTCSYPRPAVGVGKVDFAIDLMSRMHNIDIEMIYITGDKETSEKAQKTLSTLGITSKITGGDYTYHMPDNTLVVAFPDHEDEVNHFSHNLDKPNVMMVCSPCIEDKTGMFGKYNPVRSMGLAEQYPGLYVGMAAPENAALLAAQIVSLSHPEEGVIENVHEMLNKRTAKSVFGYKR